MIEVTDEVRVIDGRHAGQTGLVIDTDVFEQPGRTKYVKVMFHDKEKTAVVLVETHLERVE